MTSTTLPDSAAAKLMSGYNCAQAVLFASAERLHLDPEIAHRIACGFGAGMGREEEVCGAVTGAIMAIGLRHGRGQNEGKERTEETYRRTRQLMDAFRQRHGSVVCRDLIRCNLLTPEGQEYYKKNDLLHGTCEKCVRTAAELVGEHL